MGLYPTRMAAVMTLIAGMLISHLAQAQEKYHGRRVWALQNDRIRVLVAPGGGHIASLTLQSGRGANLNPLWLPPWPSVEPGQWRKTGGKYGSRAEAPLLSTILGHNICLDFFGSPSAAEAAAGIPVHGEAPCVTWTEQQREPDRLVYSALLPQAQMRVSRTITLAPGSSALWITETVENLAPFDRPFGWQQHPTFGPPFLERGATLFDMPAVWSMVLPGSADPGRRLKPGATFDWPNAPGRNDEVIDLREWPVAGRSGDYTVSLIDPSRIWGWFTAINTKRGLLVGYVWPRKEWPWVGNWEENRLRTDPPWLGRAVTRGMEFGTTPFPEGRRAAIARGTLHRVPTYRWIGARSRQTISYGVFLAPTPPGTTGVRDVDVNGDSITIELEGVEKTITLKVRR